MSRVVVDTNDFISSFFGGNPRKIIDLWESGGITLCLSKSIVDEYIEVLRRLGLHNEKEIEALLGLFAHGFHIVFTAKTPELHMVEKDPDDNMFLECAVMCGGFKGRICYHRRQSSPENPRIHEYQNCQSRGVSDQIYKT